MAVLVSAGTFAAFLSSMMGVGGASSMVPATGSWATLLGSSLAVRLPELALRLVFAAVLMWTGTKDVRTRRPPATAT